MQKDLFLFLVLRLLVGIVDFLQVVQLQSEVLLCVLSDVVESEVFTIFLRLEIEVVKKLYKSFVELSDFNI